MIVRGRYRIDERNGSIRQKTYKKSLKYRVFNYSTKFNESAIIYLRGPRTKKKIETFFSVYVY